MKVVLHRLDRLLKLGAAAGLLLIGQQALAIGTDAGTPIDNTAVIDYSVNGASQTPLNASAPQFVVDRVVNFTLGTPDGALTQTAPGETGAIVLYTLTNTGNSPLDFRLVADNLAAGDEDDMVPTSFVVFVDTNGNGVLDAGENEFVDALAEGDDVTITVIADAPAIVNNGDRALVELTAIAADPYDGVSIVNPAADGSLGGDLVNGAVDATGVIETVFDEDGPGVGGDGRQVFDADGYQFDFTALTIGKGSTIISDPVNGTSSPFAIPGAIVEYTVSISNPGSSSTTSLTITDDIQADLNFQISVPDYGASGENVRIDFTDASVGGPASTSYCVAEIGVDTNSDGCRVDPIGGAGGVPQLTITAPALPNLETGDSVDVLFRVEIDNT